MLIEVNADHIKNGKTMSCGHCPIANALRSAGFMFPWVQAEEVNVDVGNIFKLPRSAQRFIQRFDIQKPVKPFRFKLETT